MHPSVHHQTPPSSVFLTPHQRALSPTREPDSGGKRLRKINDKQAKAAIEAQVATRFLQEVHLCEKEGRVENREMLEKDLLLSIGAISEIRAGRRGVLMANIIRFKQKYNADYQFIMFGVRDRDHSGVMMGGRDLRKPEGESKPRAGYEYPYKSDGIDLVARISPDESSENSH